MFSTRIGGDEPEGCIALILYLACGIRPPEPPRKLAPSTRSRKSSGRFMNRPALVDAATLPTIPYSGPPSDASTADDEGQPSSEAMDSDSPRPPISRSVSSDELLRIRHGQAYAQSQRISQSHPLTDYFPRAGSWQAEPAVGAMEAFFDRLFPPVPKRKFSGDCSSKLCAVFSDRDRTYGLAHPPETLSASQELHQAGRFSKLQASSCCPFRRSSDSQVRNALTCIRSLGLSVYRNSGPSQSDGPPSYGSLVRHTIASFDQARLVVLVSNLSLS
ncbi:hypothetical protein FOZ63_006820, partial [Perkinsus olseni]